MEEKRKFRQTILSELKQIPEEEHSQLSDQIAETLYIQPEWKRASVIGITISRPPEINTYTIIEHAWLEGKRVAVPKCIPATKEMEFRYITRFEQLESVYYGLQEPIRDKTKLAEPSELGLLIVPGLAFTKKGYRLGFGGGYYDRFLSSYYGETISLATNRQILADIPVEPHDKPVSKIITEQEVIFPWC